eukprot:CAMPEP_0172739290 /NCGR_PEP_ID=MMETSP1074-20121228/122257_1 /TAXON_ID=2916 /ORGANISM="Ceratium fusus, Strain PA161109" /LENGTH=32 /DNA_ID= /DNA_START= /DNA_END= /DNA_ORIENTATION=
MAHGTRAGTGGAQGLSSPVFLWMSLQGCTAVG